MGGITSLTGQVAVVTGAGSGIGRATAERFAAEGCKVVLADLRQDRLDEVTAGISAKGGECASHPTDVASWDAMKGLAAFANDTYGPVDILFNNAGVGLGGGFLEYTDDDWEWIVGINLWGVIYGMRAFLPDMVARRHGHIVNTASMAGLVPSPPLSAYAATKHAVVGLSTTTRIEMQPHNVGISVLCPGLIRTNIAVDGRIHAKEGDKTTQESATHALQRFGRPPERVAQVVVNAIRRNKLIAPVGIEAFLFWRLWRLSPAFADWFIGRMQGRLL